MMKKFKDLQIENKLYSEKNIYLALYSVESYIGNKELLSEKDKIELIKLHDKFDKDNIQKWIIRIQNRLHQLMDENDYLHAGVFFKPKKYNKQKNKVIFRPLHSAILLEQITAVALLNILIYEFDENSKISMSNLSRLIPHNFYGNRVAYEPERLFKPWQEQYKKYTSYANELYKKYHENGEYKWEVNLDLENFFPSINPICLYNYIGNHFSVSYTNDERKFMSKILKKLIFVKLDVLHGNDLFLYTNDENIKKCQFVLGIPQGMPQAYFLANIYMIEIQKMYKKIFPGELLFYVDDSAIFTNEIKNVADFKDKIAQLNKTIEGWNNELYKEKFANLDKEIINFVQEKISLFGIKIHEPGEKSTISDIANSKEGEVNLHCIGRETSKAAFEINTSYSDEESKILFNKTSRLLDAIESELEQLNIELEEDLEDDIRIYKEAYKKKIVRYRKFFKYRNKDLAYREKSDSTEIEKELIEDLNFLENGSKDELEEFFQKYNEDTLGASISFVLKSMRELGKDYTEITRKIVKLNKLLFGRENRKTSYIYFAYKEYIDNCIPKQVEICKYSYLQKIVKEQKPSTYKKTDEIRKQLVTDELNNVYKEGFDPIKNYLGEKFKNVIELVEGNSEQLNRQIMNAFISYLYQIEISDDALICKSNNRKITYTELRLLMFLRNKKFTSTKFKALFENILLEEYQVSIDYSIIQVISFFKTFVSEPDYIDNLILVHKYTCDIWKNGSKHLYFYTLHNQEHAVDLIQNSIKVIRAIDYIDISRNDYYVLFIACYLHDISMVTLPNLDEIQKDKFDCNKIYSDFVETVRKEEKTSKLAINPVKKLLKDYYVKMDVFYEKIVRENHAKNSAREIRNRNDLKFVDAAIREIVAEVSEAHGYNVSEIYKIKSNASSKIWSQKYTKIILRLADLLDMSNYRVSQLVLNHNLDNMGETSRFHWLSHLVTRGYNINTEYIFTKEDKKSLLDRGSIKEKIVLTVFVDLPQFTKGVNGGCKNMKLDGVSENKISLVCDEECKSDQCNFLCKWFAKKNEYLFVELASLREYLNSVPDRYFESEIEVIVDSRNKNFLSEKQFTMLKEYVEG